MNCEINTDMDKLIKAENRLKTKQRNFSVYVDRLTSIKVSSHEAINELVPPPADQSLPILEASIHPPTHYENTASISIPIVKSILIYPSIIIRMLPTCPSALINQHPSTIMRMTPTSVSVPTVQSVQASYS